MLATLGAALVGRVLPVAVFTCDGQAISLPNTILGFQASIPVAWCMELHLQGVQGAWVVPGRQQPVLHEVLLVLANGDQQVDGTSARLGRREVLQRVRQIHNQHLRHQSVLVLWQSSPHLALSACRVIGLRES